MLKAKVVFWPLVLATAMLILMSAVKAQAKTESRYQQAKRIVDAVFPDNTQAAALRVLACETGGTYWSGSYNPSGATGYFQILRGNGGRTFRYRNMRFTIKAWKLKMPWHNVQAAFWLSHGGRDWHEWVCQP